MRSGFARTHPVFPDHLTPAGPHALGAAGAPAAARLAVLGARAFWLAGVLRSRRSPFSSWRDQRGVKGLLVEIIQQHGQQAGFFTALAFCFPRLRASGKKRCMRSVCSLSRLRRRASSRVMIRSETIRSTSSSLGRGRSCRLMA